MKHSLFTLIAIGFLSVGLLGCEQEGPAEQAGEDIDQSIEQAGEKLEEAGDEIRESTDK